MKKNNYKVIPGEAVKIVKNRIKENLISNGKRELQNKPEKSRKRIERVKYGKFENSDLKYLVNGLQFIQMACELGVNQAIQYLTTDGKELESSTANKIAAMTLLERPIIRGIETMKEIANIKYKNEKKIERIKDIQDIINNSRDGIITKKQTRTEKDEDGKEIEVQTEVSMSEADVATILEDYFFIQDRVEGREFSEYLGLGMSTLSLLGSVLSNQKNKNGKAVSGTLTLGALINIGTAIGKRKITSQYGEKVGGEDRKSYVLRNEFIRDEPVSYKEEEEKITEIKSHINKADEEAKKIELKVGIINAINAISTSLVMGVAYANELKNKDKIDAKSLSGIIYKCTQTNGIVNNLSINVMRLYELQRDKSDLKYSTKELDAILQQIEEKQDPLVEAKDSFESIEVKDLHGKFYPKINPKTNKQEFSHRLDISEFSVKKGEVVLLTGDSGSGKSTFIRLLKRGDINNRMPITVDGEQKVDKLGKQFIAFKADKNLGTSTNVLKQIVGKESISEMTEEEKEKVKQILSEVSIEGENQLEELASKNYLEFSTGQKKRLALAQTLYRAKEQPSIILVDEPVGNVQNDLIEEQLQMICGYAKKSETMILLVTHRKDLASKYADKIYDIDNNGVMKEVTKKHDEQETENASDDKERE